MSSFAGLKVARANRQKPLATRTTGSDMSSGPSTSPTQTPVAISRVDANANEIETGNGTRPEVADDKMDSLTVKNAGEPSTPVTGLPRYADFPETKLEVRKRKSAGRGIYVRSGAKIKQGELHLIAHSEGPILKLTSRCDMIRRIHHPNLACSLSSRSKPARFTVQSLLVRRA